MIGFVCRDCTNDQHCERRDTWCDCQCRKDRNGSERSPEGSEDTRTQ